MSLIFQCIKFRIWSTRFILQLNMLLWIKAPYKKAKCLFEHQSDKLQRSRWKQQQRIIKIPNSSSHIKKGKRKKKQNKNKMKLSSAVVTRVREEEEHGGKQTNRTRARHCINLREKMKSRRRVGGVMRFLSKVGAKTHDCDVQMGKEQEKNRRETQTSVKCRRKETMGSN